MSTIFEVALNYVIPQKGYVYSGVVVSSLTGIGLIIIGSLGISGVLPIGVSSLVGVGVVMIGANIVLLIAFQNYNNKPHKSLEVVEEIDVLEEIEEAEEPVKEEKKAPGTTISENLFLKILTPFNIDFFKDSSHLLTVAIQDRKDFNEIIKDFSLEVQIEILIYISIKENNSFAIQNIICDKIANLQRQQEYPRILFHYLSYRFGVLRGQQEAAQLSILSQAKAKLNDAISTSTKVEESLAVAYSFVRYLLQNKEYEKTLLLADLGIDNPKAKDFSSNVKYLVEKAKSSNDEPISFVDISQWMITADDFRTHS